MRSAELDPNATSPRDEEDEEVGLTTGEAVPSRRPRTVAISLCALLAGAALGLALGLIIATLHPSKELKIMFPMAGSLIPLNFLVVGDWGRDGQFNQSQNAEGMARVAAGLRADFMISTGDNFYDTGLADEQDPQFKTSFTDVYSAPPLQTQWYSVLGNHDYITNSEAQLNPAMKDRDPRWHCERSYRVRHGDCPPILHQRCVPVVDIFFVDTSPLLNRYWGGGSETLNFTSLPDQPEATRFIIRSLKEDLEASDATWKFVVGHHPVFSTGVHGSTEELTQSFLPLFKTYGVDLYINGHDHNLELIKTPDHATHFVTSGAGSKIRTDRPQGEYMNMSKFYHDLQGFVSVSVHGRDAQVQYHNAAGEPMHTLTLSK